MDFLCFVCTLYFVSKGYLLGFYVILYNIQKSFRMILWQIEYDFAIVIAEENVNWFKHYNSISTPLKRN